MMSPVQAGSALPHSNILKSAMAKVAGSTPVSVSSWAFAFVVKSHVAPVALGPQ
jgi:hypothetical protein